MTDPPHKRLLYIALIGVASIVPLVVNRDYGGLFALVSVGCVTLFIRSDRQEAIRPGFPVLLKAGRLTDSQEPGNDRPARMA
jgi:hypothetical protein